MSTFIGIELSRGIAALMVMVFHYSFMVTDKRTVLNFLCTGVDLFFVISGFVFAKMIISSKIDLGYFFIRRFFRIYPLYFLALITYFFLTESHANKIDYFIRHILFLQTTNSKEEAYFFNLAFWTLPVEVEFYLFVPIFAFLMKLKNFLISLFIFSIGLKLLIILSTSDEISIYAILGVHLTGILPEFIIGILLYKIVTIIDNDFIRYRPVLNISSAIIGCVIIYFLSSFLISYGDNGLKEYKIFGGFFNFLCAVGYACILFPLSFINKQILPGYLIRMFFTVGAISYPVYLFHNASPKIFHLIGLKLSGEYLFLSSIIFTIVFSFFIHKFIEEPSRLFGRALSGNKSA